MWSAPPTGPPVNALRARCTTPNSNLFERQNRLKTSAKLCTEQQSPTPKRQRVASQLLESQPMILEALKLALIPA